MCWYIVCLKGQNKLRMSKKDSEEVRVVAMKHAELAEVKLLHSQFEQFHFLFHLK